MPVYSSEWVSPFVRCRIWWSCVAAPPVWKFERQLPHERLPPEWTCARLSWPWTCQAVMGTVSQLNHFDCRECSESCLPSSVKHKLSLVVGPGDTPAYMDAWLCVQDTQLPLKGVAFRPDVSLLVSSCIVCLQLLRPKWDSFNSSSLTFKGQQSSGRKTPRPLPSRRLSMCTHCQTLGDSADFVRRRRLCRSSSGGCRWTSLSALARTPARTTRTCRRRRSGSVARSCGRRHLSPSSATSHYLSMASCRVCVNEFRTSTLRVTPAQVTSTSAIEPSSCTPPCTTATLEEAAVDLNIPTYSITESRVCVGYSKTCLGNQLLEDRVAGFASEFSC